ncbi:ABC transporter ATP-binding protein [Mameliella sediminis]|uniref:ABC transporter ATP-binding protein n=1 Tax=Mameliella sediminis TaxID=2836866 RepID=UPI001C456974|nr:ABC transporter ATP-binding protein [Mameliella sediminis]MBV7392960.1 ABC transporter ATP-binding protein [Mameliella sediminis]
MILPGRLRIENLCLTAGRAALVRDVSLDVAPGEMLGVLGPNGAGKSSLLRTVYRMSRPDSGRVLIDDEDVWHRSSAWVAQRVGAVLQDMPAEFPLTVRDVVAMGRSAHKALLAADTAHDIDLIDAALALQHLTDMQDRAFGTLSGGERQRVLLARALVQQPRVLVLDEPTNHLDIRYQLSLLRFVREIGVTVIAALHDLNLAAMFCDRLCLMDKGRVLATGRPHEVLTQENLSRVYGIETLIQRHPTTGSVWVFPV